MLQFGMLVDFEALIKGEIEKLKRFLLQHIVSKMKNMRFNWSYYIFLIH